MITVADCTYICVFIHYTALIWNGCFIKHNLDISYKILGLYSSTVTICTPIIKTLILEKYMYCITSTNTASLQVRLQHAKNIIYFKKMKMKMKVNNYHYSLVITFPIIPPAIAISGLIAMITRVSFHPYTKPKTNPTKTNVMDMMNIPIFWPMPSFTLFRSLWKKMDLN